MHWYKRDGTPCYEVPYAKKEGTRPTTLADARKLSLVPSVTTILDVMAKPALEIYRVNEAIMSALTTPRDPEDTDEAFLYKVKAGAKERSEIAMAEGTAIHNAIENAFKGETIPKQYRKVAKGVKDAVIDRYGGGEWVSEKTFAHAMGYGGMVDLHSHRIVIDFKTKEKFALKLAYEEQCMQLAAYRRGLDLPEDTMLVNCFVQWDGEIVFYEWEKEDEDRAWRGFLRCLDMWCWKNKYEPLTF